LDEELKQLRESLEHDPEIRLETLEDPDTQTLRNALDQKAIHILHYMGHGAFDPASGEGALLLGGPQGRLPVTGRHLAAKLKDLDTLRLVVLNACETAVVGGESARGPFAGVAAALVLGGVPAVVAMQSSIQDAHSLAFTSAFYRRLARGMSVEEAVTEGRQAILSQEPETAAWANPVLFLRAAGNLIAQERQAAQRRSLLPWIFLLGLLVALGGVLMDRYGEGFRSSPLAIPPKAFSTKPNPAPQPPPSQTPSGGTTTVATPPPPKHVRWVRLVLAIPAGFQHGTVLVDGKPARVLGRLPNFIDIQVPEAQPVAVRVEGRGKVCEQTVLATPTSEPVNICEEGH
jgi:hypothetical protein